MKKKIFLPFITLLSLGMLAGCNNPPAPKIIELEIIDTHDEYAVGDSFDAVQELSIKAIYDNDDVVDVAYEDVEINLLREYDIDGEKREQDILAPFSYSGQYSYQVTYKDFVSTKINLTVLTGHSYITYINLSGDEVGEVGSSSKLKVSYLPTNTTSSINYTAEPASKVKLTKKNDGVEVEYLEDGEITIKASGRAHDGTELSYEHTINVDMKEIPLIKMEQTYQTFCYNKTYYYYGQHYKYSSCPTEGEAKVLIIPVWFTDSNTIIQNEEYKANVREDIRKAYLGTPEEVGWHSVKSYYETESAGKLTLNGTVSDWYNANYNIASVGSSGNITSSILNSAVRWYFDNNPEENRLDYDCDHNGYLDSVMLIYAAPDSQQAGYGNYGNLWAYCNWTLNSANTTKPTPNVYFWASYDFMYDYRTAMERTGVGFSRGDCTHTSVDSHCLIHEMGHVFGLDDYYDYADNNSTSPAGGFSMQDYNVGGHDAFSVMAYGWASAYIPTENTVIKLRPFQEYKEAILLTPSWNEYNSPFDEYLLLELYTPTGLNELDANNVYLYRYPSGTTDVGIRLWHIDARLVKDNGSTLRPTFYNDVTIGNVNTAFNNTSSGGRASPYGADYNILQLIRKDKTQDYKSSKNLSNDDLFKTGDTFSMDDYADQFVNGVYLNSKIDLGWEFKVNAIHNDNNGTFAFIEIAKIEY